MTPIVVVRRQRVNSVSKVLFGQHCLLVKYFVKKTVSRFLFSSIFLVLHG